MVDQGGTAVETPVAAPEPEGELPLDPVAVERAYRLHRARRRARVERRREKRRAGLRFWLVLLVLVAASIAILVVIAQEVQRLFGI